MKSLYSLILLIGLTTSSLASSPQEAFSSFENLDRALSALRPNTTETKTLFSPLSHERFWHLAEQLQGAAVMWNKDPELRMKVRSVQESLLRLADIPRLGPLHSKIFEGKLSSAEFDQLIDPVKSHPQLADLVNVSFDPGDLYRLSYVFCVAHESELLMLQLLHQIDSKQRHFNNLKAIKIVTGELANVVPFIAIASELSLYQYFIKTEDDSDKLTVQISCPISTSDGSSYNDFKDVFEIELNEFEQLRPISSYLSTYSLGILIDKTMTADRVSKLNIPGKQVLAALKEEQGLRTGKW